MPLFKRRRPLSWLESFRELFYPRSGWRRAIEYVGHRIKRLPDTPHNICIGIAAGVFVTFTPLFGFHFVLAALIAWSLRGNIFASLLSTFVGNPITFPFIASLSYNVGLRMMGYDRQETAWVKIREGFSEAWSTLWANFKSLFGATPVPWDGMGVFFWDVFVPYTVGGILPGLFFAVLFYFGMRPVVSAYQKRRKGKLLEKFNEIRAKRSAGKTEG